MEKWQSWRVTLPSVARKVIGSAKRRKKHRPCDLQSWHFWQNKLFNVINPGLPQENLTQLGPIPEWGKAPYLQNDWKTSLHINPHVSSQDHVPHLRSRLCSKNHWIQKTYLDIVPTKQSSNPTLHEWYCVERFWHRTNQATERPKVAPYSLENSIILITLINLLTLASIETLAPTQSTVGKPSPNMHLNQ